MEEDLDPRPTMGLHPRREAVREGARKFDHTPGRENPTLPRLHDRSESSARFLHSTDSSG